MDWTSLKERQEERIFHAESNREWEMCFDLR